MTAKLVEINRIADFCERVAWTFVEAFLGLITIDAFSSLNASWWQTIAAAGMASFYTTAKVLVAQHKGQTPTGDLSPVAPLTVNASYPESGKQ